LARFAEHELSVHNLVVMYGNYLVRCLRDHPNVGKSFFYQDLHCIIY
jgi:hypothetical protein